MKYLDLRLSTRKDQCRSLNKIRVKIRSRQAPPRVSLKRTLVILRKIASEARSTTSSTTRLKITSLTQAIWIIKTEQLTLYSRQIFKTLICHKALTGYLKSIWEQILALIIILKISCSRTCLCLSKLHNRILVANQYSKWTHPKSPDQQYKAWCSQEDTIRAHLTSTVALTEILWTSRIHWLSATRRYSFKTWGTARLYRCSSISWTRWVHYSPTPLEITCTHILWIQMPQFSIKGMLV